MADRTTLSNEIDKQLRLQRPDRYDPQDDGWLDTVAAAIPDELLPEAEVRRLYKRELVKRREGVATRRANKLLRGYNQTDQLEWHWWNEANEPISVEWREFDDDGNSKTRLERVALRAVEPRDLRMWAENEEVDAERDREARMDAVNGARKIADAIESGGYATFADWAESEHPVEETA